MSTPQPSPTPATQITKAKHKRYFLGKNCLYFPVQLVLQPPWSESTLFGTSYSLVVGMLYFNVFQICLALFSVHAT